MIKFFSLPTTAFAVLAGLSLPVLAADAKAPLGLEASPVVKVAQPGTAKVGTDGFLNRWFLLDPIPGTGQVNESAVRVAAQKEYFTDQQTVMPHAGDKVKVGDAEYTWHAIEAKSHNVNLYHFAFFQGKETSNVVFWGVTTVNSPEEMTNVRLAVGSNSGSVWWVNGEEKVALYGDIQTFIDDTASKKFTLKKGPNIVRFIVVNNRGMVDCCARFLDANGSPITNLTTTLSAATASASR